MSKLNTMLRDWCKASDDNLQRLLDVVTDDDNMMGGYEDQMEHIFVEVYGERVECPKCSSPVFPGHECWGCEDWTAPYEQPAPEECGTCHGAKFVETFDPDKPAGERYGEKPCACAEGKGGRGRG